jgi:hypothetical protein
VLWCWGMRAPGRSLMSLMFRWIVTGLDWSHHPGPWSASGFVVLKCFLLPAAAQIDGVLDACKNANLVHALFSATLPDKVEALARCARPCAAAEAGRRPESSSVHGSVRAETNNARVCVLPCV